MFDWMREHDVTGLLIRLAAAAVLIGVPTWLLARHWHQQDRDFDHHCRADGGHIRLEKHTMAGTDSSGRVDASTETWRYCLDHQGNVLRIRF